MSLKIVVPDDFPPALTGSAAEPRLRALGDVTVHTERGSRTSCSRRTTAA
jgi:hypothetical protein